jgi:hypothetical protein
LSITIEHSAALGWRHFDLLHLTGVCTDFYLSVSKSATQLKVHFIEMTMNLRYQDQNLFCLRTKA